MKNNLDTETITRIVLEQDEYMFTSPEYMRGVVDGIEFALSSELGGKRGNLYCPFDGDAAEGDAWKLGSRNGISAALEQIELAGEELDLTGTWN
jgi:hypothetical protein